MNNQQSDKKLKVLHAPLNIANQGWLSARALRQRGHQAECWTFYSNKFDYPNDKFYQIKELNSKKLWHIFLQAVNKFDIFHFHSSLSFFHAHPIINPIIPEFYDLLILKSLGKKIFMSMHGGDLRLPSVHQAINPWGAEYHQATSSILSANEDFLKKRLDFFQNTFDNLFVSYPELLNYAPQADLLPRVIELRKWHLRPTRYKKVLTIIHAPSRRQTKGSQYIIKGIQKLQEKGYRIKFKLLEGLSHNLLKKEVENCDIFIDQVLIGDYGVAAIEAMAAGKVAVAYLMPNVLKYYQKHTGLPPIYNVNPQNFVPKMKKLLDSSRLVNRLGIQARQFVEKHHNLEQLGVILEQKYLNSPFKFINQKNLDIFHDYLNLDKKQDLIDHLRHRVAHLAQDLQRYQARIDKLNAALASSRNSKQRLNAALASSHSSKQRLIYRFRRQVQASRLIRSLMSRLILFFSTLFRKR